MEAIRFCDISSSSMSFCLSDISEVSSTISSFNSLQIALLSDSVSVSLSSASSSSLSSLSPSSSSSASFPANNSQDYSHTQLDYSRLLFFLLVLHVATFQPKNITRTHCRFFARDMNLHGALQTPTFG